MIDMRIASIALVGFLLTPFAGIGAADDVTWIADKNGCKVANPFPQAGETITWSGACEDGLAHGEGVLQWFVNGKTFDHYEGTLQLGWAEGKGTLTRSEGGRYSGEWKHSLQDGSGRYDAGDGSWYEGQWKNGQPHGQGRYQSPDGRVITGEWVDGEYEGNADTDGNPNRI